MWSFQMITQGLKLPTPYNLRDKLTCSSQAWPIEASMTNIILSGVLKQKGAHFKTKTVWAMNRLKLILPRR